MTRSSPWAIRALGRYVARLRSIQGKVTNRLFTDTRGEPVARASGVHQDNHRGVVLWQQANLREERPGAAVVRKKGTCYF